MGKPRTILAADLFCGAGGTSQGILMAANSLNADLHLLAINHWQVAIDTHSLNHPEAQNLCTGVDVVDPLKLVPGGRLDLLCASPECTHHSVARGGKPCNDQSRASAWHILRWAQVLYIENLIIENVPEFQSWGPLGANGRPMKSKRGELFQQFISSLKALGYRVEYRVLNCADYGAPTTRKRLFLIARRGNKKIVWPEPTHMRPAGSMPIWDDARAPWKTARQIIDWDLPSRSIFGRKKPLAEKTILRIETGLRKFCNIDVNLRKCVAEDLWPFIVVMRGTGTAVEVDSPLPTVTASGNHYALVQPFLAAAGGPEGSGREPKSVNDPMATVIGENHTALVEPYLITVNHGEGDTSRRAQSVDAPLGTATSKIGTGICEPFLIAYYGTAQSSHADEPVQTITTKDRFALVEAEVTRYRLDIRFRMLQPTELARAQGFPDSYKFTGKREDVVKQIGNAVPPPMAAALCGSVMA